MNRSMEASELLAFVEASDIAYKRAFSRMERRLWGILFWNEGNPGHYDANHAHLSGTVSDEEEAERIVQEIVAFFASKAIIPRLYLYAPERMGPLLDVLGRHGFRTETLPSIVQVWQGKLAEAPPVPGMSIEPVTRGNYEDCLLVESVPELGGREIREESFACEFAHPAFSHFLLRVAGEPASTLCLLQEGSVFRIENVATLPAYRGRGLVGHLIRHAQEQFVQKGGSRLWVSPIDQRVERVYSRYGFSTVGKFSMVHAFRGGKGILELR